MWWCGTFQISTNRIDHYGGAKNIILEYKAPSTVHYKLIFYPHHEFIIYSFFFPCTDHFRRNEADR